MIGPVRVSKNGPISRIGAIPGCCCVTWCDGVDLAQTFRRNLRRRIFDQHQSCVAARSPHTCPSRLPRPIAKSTIAAGSGDPSGRAQPDPECIWLYFFRDSCSKPLGRCVWQRGRIALVAIGLREQSGQLPKLRSRHHAHLVEDSIHQNVSLIKQHTVILESGLPSNRFLAHILESSNT